MALERSHVLVIALALGGALAGFGLSVWMHPARIPQTSALVGSARPALQLPDVAGKRTSIDRWDGRLVLLNFWASWCEPCRAEMPSLELLAQRHEGDRLQVLAVNHRESDAAIRRFIDETALTLPVLRDADGAAARAWGVGVFPSTIVIGRDGRARFSVLGELDWTGLEARAWIAAVL